MFQSNFVIISQGRVITLSEIDSLLTDLSSPDEINSKVFVITQSVSPTIVTVKLSGAVSATLNFSFNEEIGILTKKIESLTMIPQSEQRLILCGKIVTNIQSCLIGDYFIYHSIRKGKFSLENPSFSLHISKSNSTPKDIISPRCIFNSLFLSPSHSSPPSFASSVSVSTPNSSPTPTSSSSSILLSSYMPSALQPAAFTPARAPIMLKKVPDKIRKSSLYRGLSKPPSTHDRTIMSTRMNTSVITDISHYITDQASKISKSMGSPIKIKQC